MDIQSTKTLLELKFMQSLSNAGTVNESNATDEFTSLLQSVLNQSVSNDDSIASTFGSHASLVEALTQNTTSSTIGNVQNVNSYVANFLLKNDQSTASLQAYSSDYTGQKNYESLLEGANQYADAISSASKTYNVPEKLIAAVMKQESNFNANAVSSAGATGLMQLMPATAKYLGVTDAKNPEQNIMGGAKYLRQMLDQFDNNLSLALAAYNAGPGNVKKYGGIPPFKETQNYVTKVTSYYKA